MQGSPPHTRGKEAMSSIFEWCRRITPAHAGKRFLHDFLLLVKKDHPRTRGEKTHDVVLLILKIGSPPHTRGKERTYAHERNEQGITPAHAGKSR